MSRRLLGLVLALALSLVGASSAAAAPAYEGLQLHSLWGSVTSTDMTRELDLTDGTGSNVVRIDVGWATLEQNGKGVWNSSYRDKLDRFVAGADARGMKVILTLWSTPCWASSAPDDLKQNCEGSWWDRGVQLYAPRNPADFADAAAWLAARYGSKLAAIEVWNEPTLTSTRFWIAPDRAAAYVDLLRATFPKVNAASSGVDVLATLNGCDKDFLTAIYDKGAKGNYDGLGVHPYGSTPWYCDPIHDLQRSRGDDTPLWITEFGFATGDGSWGVTAAQQASLITQTFVGARTRSWIRATVLYELRDEGTDPGDMEDNWGLVKRDYTPKLAYQALADVLGGSAADALPPLAPTGLTALAGDARVTLDWADNKDLDLKGYDVYRATTTGGPYTKVNTTLLTTSTYVDATGLVNGTTYYYVVRARDTAGNDSPNSLQVLAKPVAAADVTAPLAPAALTAAASDGKVTLDWADNAETDLAGYDVYRSTSSGGGYTQVNASALTGSSFEDTTNLVNGTTYYYVVRARDTAGNVSPSSTEVSAKPAAAGDPLLPPPDETPPPAEEPEDPPVQFTLQIKERKGILYAIGTGPANTKIVIEQTDCNSASDRTYAGETNSQGAFNIKLGKAKALRGCDFEAKLAPSDVSTVSVESASASGEESGAELEEPADEGERKKKKRKKGKKGKK